MKDLKRKFCPNCGSEDIKWSIPQNWSIWECFNCGYMGPVIVEDVEIAEEIKKKYKSKHPHKSEDYY